MNLNGGTSQGWFVADSEDGKTRHFVIQGSINFDSWRVNLAFDPVVMLDPRLGAKVWAGSGSFGGGFGQMCLLVVAV